MPLQSDSDRLRVALALLVVTAALVGAVATTTAQSTDQPRLTADRHVVRGQTVALDLARVLDDRPEESFELRRVSQNGSVGATVAAFDAADGGSATLDTGAFDPGRYVVTYGRTAAVRFDDGTGTVVGAATNESAVERADFRVVTAENASVTLPDDPISLADGTALVTADTTLLPGTELTIRARSDADARSPFVQSTAPTVGPDGSVTTTFDTPANASTAVQVTVLYEDTTLAETTAPLGQRASPTASPTSATTGDTTTRPPDTRTTVPGFGAAVAVLAVLGAGLLAGRR